MSSPVAVSEPFIVPEQPAVLVLDDNTDLLLACKLCLKSLGCRLLTSSEPAELLTILRSQRIDVLLLDMNFSRDAASGAEGLYYLKQALALQPDLKVVLMTAYADVGLAVQAMQLGARDFVAKPWQNEQLRQIIARQLAQVAPVPSFNSNPMDPSQSQPLLGDSPAMQQVRQLIQKAAATDANILLLGESGTGKQVVAEAIHRASMRAQAPLVCVDMGSITPSLLESELFGHKKGAFTGAVTDAPGRFRQARGGTLFLDELSNLALADQAKLLTVLQKRQVISVGATASEAIDLRLICASNQGLQQLADQGLFRQDLLYRINTVEIVLPPLRQRREDIPTLAQYYLAMYVSQYQRSGLQLTPSQLDLLSQYHWPGNVRQLAHVLERAVVLSENSVLDFSQLQTALTFAIPATDINNPDHDTSAITQPNAGSASPDFLLEQVEAKTIRQALSFYQGNISQAAQALGLTRGALYRRLEKYGL